MAHTFKCKTEACQNGSTNAERRRSLGAEKAYHAAAGHFKMGRLEKRIEALSPRRRKQAEQRAQQLGGAVTTAVRLLLTQWSIQECMAADEFLLQCAY